MKSKDDDYKRIHRFYPFDTYGPTIVVVPAPILVEPVGVTGGTGVASAAGSTPAAEPIKPADDAGATASTLASTPASSPVVNSDASFGVADGTDATPAVEPDVATGAGAQSTPTTVAAANCLTKEYIDSGAVMFRDTCTKEWAINSTDVDKKVASAATTCLTKDRNQTGVVTFRDSCTREWAMNTRDQLAQAPQAR